MTKGLMFWIIFLVVTLFLGWHGWNNRPQAPISFALWLLILLLGWGVFGSPIK
jgi:hypothetical protein